VCSGVCVACGEGLAKISRHRPQNPPTDPLVGGDVAGGSEHGLDRVVRWAFFNNQLIGQDRPRHTAPIYTKYGVNRFACAAARDRATCANHHTIRGDDVEKAILRGLKTRLMDPSLFEEFAREFMAEVNRQQSTASAAKAGIRSALEQIERQITRLIDAILEGADAKPINAKLKELEAEKERLESALNEASQDKLLLHPNLAAIYRAHVETIEAALRDPDHGREAFEIVRSLIEQVRIIPTDGEITIELKGELVGILVLAEGAKRCSGSLLNRALQIKMVAGARYSFDSPRPQYGFRLSETSLF
jgi:hypothetical protein